MRASSKLSSSSSSSPSYSPSSLSTFFTFVSGFGFGAGLPFLAVAFTLPFPLPLPLGFPSSSSDAWSACLAAATRARAVGSVKWVSLDGMIVSLLPQVQSEASRRMGAKEVIVCRAQMTIKYDSFSSSEDQGSPERSKLSRVTSDDDETRQPFVIRRQTKICAQHGVYRVDLETETWNLC
ncbi:uncharacterized protein K444DRAFT_5553 [Hyaloscypha bicolor E]|uniref:Uncharacterized protein n=1 Tax=Hyaloscypha bicolor E TaxID=1095630 RepID=A0A2J6TVQ4_9HELO|nr:uncharacterized protein K444DRAFT_5553 [Hyaloscypha bicolor E]PMD67085.1 hypothetical protein K444DRAFT_5553 [Hyaloscypha bicolor E]